ncbi:hypothetical protein B0T26DRAFT_763671 [Lasiosphaeria miniovina]|uniref:Uncharacterized protein n=1 Tax=Lasiosphaeria miniovina TaxID=1954250 RepID=A0AA39ZP67_9PEZI|nr:uncharacterized protein B0T26DRAFT_763671 [Lasiosphaeria miniovina]KAK0701087.1 hypothetical protein B0T26DRAFT_763671 [Lasiosphaeria miniovina]
MPSTLTSSGTSSSTPRSSLRSGTPRTPNGCLMLSATAPRKRSSSIRLCFAIATKHSPTGSTSRGKSCSKAPSWTPRSTAALMPSKTRISSGDIIPTLVPVAAKVYIAHRRGSLPFRCYRKGTPNDLQIT